MGSLSQKEVQSALRLHGQYWSSDSTDNVRLTGVKCTMCGAGYLPAISTCSKCKGKIFESLQLSNEGELYTYTVVRGSGGVWPDEYAIGYVDYPEGVRVCGHIRSDPDGKIRIGMKMTTEKATLYTSSDGQTVECFRFRASETQE